MANALASVPHENVSVFIEAQPQKFQLDCQHIYEQRCQQRAAAAQKCADDSAIREQTVSLTPEAQTFLARHEIDAKDILHLEGNAQQLQAHEEWRDLVKATSSLSSQGCLDEPEMDMVVTYAMAMDEANRCNDIAQTHRLADVCWGVLDCTQAFGSGAVQGVSDVLREIKENPIGTIAEMAAWSVAPEVMLTIRLIQAAALLAEQDFATILGNLQAAQPKDFAAIAGRIGSGCLSYGLLQGRVDKVIARCGKIPAVVRTVERCVKPVKEIKELENGTVALFEGPIESYTNPKRLAPIVLSQTQLRGLIKNNPPLQGLERFFGETALKEAVEVARINPAATLERGALEHVHDITKKIYALNSRPEWHWLKCNGQGVLCQKAIDDGFKRIQPILQQGHSKRVVGYSQQMLEEAEKIWAGSSELKDFDRSIGVLKSKLPNLPVGDVTGNDISNRQLEALDRYAEKFYRETRMNRSDVKVISRNTKINEHTIQKIKDHLFNNVHNLSEGLAVFDPDPNIALAWARLIDGNFVYADLVMLEHELREALVILGTSCTYRPIHDMVNEIYGASYDWNKNYIQNRGI